MLEGNYSAVPWNLTVFTAFIWVLESRELNEMQNRLYSVCNKWDVHCDALQMSGIIKGLALRAFHCGQYWYVLEVSLASQALSEQFKICNIILDYLLQWLGLSSGYSYDETLLKVLYHFRPISEKLAGTRWKPTKLCNSDNTF